MLTTGTVPATDQYRGQRTAIVPLLLIGWVVLNYGWTCWFGFINDDYVWVERARAVATGATPPAAPWVLFLRPLVDLSFLFDYRLSGAHPFGYHLANVVFESLNALLVWRIAASLLPGVMPAALVATLFAGHSSHAGAVTWVSGRTELIGTAFYLAAVLAHVAGRRACAAGLFSLALLSKEVAVSFPVIVLVLDSVQGRDPRWRWRAAAAYFGVLVAYLLLRAWTSTTWMGYVVFQAVAHGDVVGLTRLAAQQTMGAAAALLEPLGLDGTAAAVALCGLVAAALWLPTDVAGRRAARFGGACMLVTVLPFMGVLMFFPRYGYLPSVGLALVLVGGGRGLLARLRDGRRQRWAAAGAVALWLGANEVPLQQRNEQLRRNALISGRIVQALAAAVPQPAPGTVFVVEGLGALRLGHDPWAHTPVFLFGLTEAVRLRFDDATLDAVFGIGDVPPGRPAVRLRWDAQTATFIQ